MSKEYPTAFFKDVLHLSNDPVSIDPLSSYPISGVYSFGRGLFARQSLLGSETTYKIFHRLHKDDFVLSQLKGWEGALARVSNTFEGWFLSPQFQTFRAVPEKIDNNYLEWYCKQSKVWEELKNKSRGMGARRDTVHPNQFLSLTIPLPPIEEQRRIVTRIEELAAKIEEARGLRREAVEEAEKLYASILGQEYDMAGSEGTFERLEDLCTKITDGTHVTPTYVLEGIPFISVKDVTTGQINFENTRLISEEEHNFFAQRCKPERDDVLLTKIGTTGFAKAIDVDREFSIFVSLALLKLDKTRITPKYTEYMLNSPRLKAYSEAGTRGVGNKNLVLKFIKDFPMPAPSLTYQNQAVARLDNLQIKLNSLKQQQTQTSAELNALLPSILDKAFKGEL